MMGIESEGCERGEERLKVRFDGTFLDKVREATTCRR
jgi:hypothetical protein